MDLVGPIYLGYFNKTDGAGENIACAVEVVRSLLMGMNSGRISWHLLDLRFHSKLWADNSYNDRNRRSIQNSSKTEGVRWEFIAISASQLHSSNLRASICHILSKDADGKISGKS